MSLYHHGGLLRHGYSGARPACSQPAVSGAVVALPLVFHVLVPSHSQRGLYIEGRGAMLPFQNITPRGAKIAWVICGILCVGSYFTPDPPGRPKNPKFTPWDQHEPATSPADSMAKKMAPGAPTPLIGPTLPPKGQS